MELSYQLTPNLKRLRLSGILETLEARNARSNTTKTLESLDSNPSINRHLVLDLATSRYIRRVMSGCQKKSARGARISIVV